MALKHRTVQRFDLRNAKFDAGIEMARRAIEEWIQQRDSAFTLNNDTLSSTSAAINEEYRGSFQRVDTSNGEAVRWQLITGTHSDFYRTNVTLLNEGSSRDSWLWYDVETSHETPRFGVPRLTPLLTRNLNGSPRDKIGDFTEGFPPPVEVNDVGKFLDEVLNAENRVVPALVSGGTDWTYEDEAHVNQAFVRLYGLATFWRLAPDAFDEFNSLVASGYEVYPGSIHSFQFDLDTEDELDTNRHWWFSRRDVENSYPSRLSRRLHQQAMRTGAQVPLPESLQGLSERFERDAGKRVIASLNTTLPTPDPPKSTAVSEPQATEDPATQRPSVGAEQVTAEPSERAMTPPASSLDVSELDALVVQASADFDVPIAQARSFKERLSGLFGGVRAKFEDLRGRIVDNSRFREMQGYVDDLVTDKTQLQKDNESLEGVLSEFGEYEKDLADKIRFQEQKWEGLLQENTYFRQQLSRISSQSSAGVDWKVPQENIDPLLDFPRPNTVSELLHTLSELDHVKFTGKKRLTEFIDDAQHSQIILDNAWSCLIDLERYARQWAAEGGVSSFRLFIDGNLGRTTPNEFAPDETNSVKRTKKFAEPRTLPVPTEVDPGGKIFMGAHFKLSQDNGKRVRLHFHDDMSNTGKIYIGYIGPHLPSRMTS